MKERMLLILLVGVFMVGIVSAVNDCDDSQTIMRLYQTSNSHVSFWNESVVDYAVEICYDEIFGETYNEVNPHSCTGTNRILSLYDVSNSHAATATDVYTNKVCYGNLACVYDVTGGAGCVNGGEIVARMYSGFNTHVSNASDTNYLTKICCVKTVSAPTFELYWADANGDPITGGEEPSIGDTIQAVVTGANSGTFTIKEKDPFDDDEIKEDVVGIAMGGNLVYEWTITQADLDKTNDFEEFFFRSSAAPGEESNTIAISGIYDDTPMDITVVKPNCGDYFTAGVVTIEIAASDDDDSIEGNVSINTVKVNSFTNGGVTFVHPFSSIGNYQIVAEAINSRGKRARHIANIIVLDDNDGKYVAACIAEPKDFSDLDTASVLFNASTTVGIEVNSSGITIVRPGENERFSWYWSFVPTGQSRNFESSSELGGYYFSVEFPTVGQNSASLRVEFI